MNQNVLEAKKAQVAKISEVLNNSKSFVVAEYRGLTVAEISQFKRTLAKSNAKCSVFKNSLVHRATENVEGFKEILEGKWDQLPEQAFHNVGTIQEAVEKAKQIEND